MARQVITKLLDDLDGGEADQTVEFAFDGIDYTIDLSEKNAGKLRKALDPFLKAGTKVRSSSADDRRGRGSRTTSVADHRERNQKIREWANKNGFELSDRGRIPTTIVDAYRAAQ
ncbi:Lsr2 family protein [Actinoplanes sp. LDG1-06]|uniref:Lsr2 family protein n=1 Tax=Paractinoplanes ovalisporus TaxID=2810368 RepID=A0ABS2AT55_9ACTN|nr:Lsr2 family protein [Actinoplanes ovalisporus]MBM2622930.1 Lsr2 family protein [Actinoplanes ovalisporus]